MDLKDNKVNAPFKAQLEKGTYFYCTCGATENQPFCNGAHKGSEFTPQKFEVEEERMKGYCQCKKTSNPPYCDGSHNK